MPPAKNLKSAGLRVGMIRAISTPPGFYVLSLLIVEATIGLVLTASKLSEDHVWQGFFVAALDCKMRKQLWDDFLVNLARDLTD